MRTCSDPDCELDHHGVEGRHPPPDCAHSSQDWFLSETDNRTTLRCSECERKPDPIPRAEACRRPEDGAPPHLFTLWDRSVWCPECEHAYRLREELWAPAPLAPVAAAVVTASRMEARPVPAQLCGQCGNADVLAICEKCFTCFRAWEAEKDRRQRKLRRIKNELAERLKQLDPESVKRWDTMRRERDQAVAHLLAVREAVAHLLAVREVLREDGSSSLV